MARLARRDSAARDLVELAPATSGKIRRDDAREDYAVERAGAADAKDPGSHCLTRQFVQ
jgi:hypothetical protein